MSTELATIDKPISTLDQIAGRFSDPLMIGVEKTFRGSVAIAAAISQMREALTPAVMRELRPLVGSPLGFLTDKSYGDETIKECIIEATLNGAYVAGNEFNIISGRCYFTKNYFMRRLREYPGLSDLYVYHNLPRIQGDSAVIKARATFKIDGDKREIEREIPIRINKGQGPDAVLGKADRKIRAAIWDYLSGSAHTREGEIERFPPMAEAEAIDESGQPDQAEG